MARLTSFRLGKILAFGAWCSASAVCSASVSSITLQSIHERYVSAQVRYAAQRISWDQFDTEQRKIFADAVTFAEAKSKATDGFAALEFVLMVPRSYYLPEGALALQVMARDYADRPEIGHVIAALSYYFPNPNSPCYQPAFELLKSVAAKNPDRVARGQAVLGLALITEGQIPLESWDSDDPKDPAVVRAEEAFEDLIRDYGDCANLRTVGVRAPTPTLAGEAETELGRLKHLRVGMVAQDITGKDLNGLPFRLSDYRGKVVFLVFWASWCGPCMAAIPHENALAERFKGKAFAIVGVNGDTSATAAKQAVLSRKIQWRSFWNGKRGPNGQIATDWEVRGWPTVYVLDQKGVIRFRGLPRDDSIAALVAATDPNP